MQHNHFPSKTFPKIYTGPIWINKLIVQLIYYNLNRWQIRNEAAHASESAEEYKKLGRLIKLQLRLFTSQTARTQTLTQSTDNLLMMFLQYQMNVLQTGSSHTWRQHHIEPNKIRLLTQPLPVTTAKLYSTTQKDET